MNSSVILLGSNTGDRFQNLRKALSLIETNVGMIGRNSHVYETAPWGKTDQPFFYNQVIEVLTPFDAHLLLVKLLDIEKEMGRERTEKWAPRLIDLDILYFNDSVIDVEGLTIPHPFLHERRFVLEPLNEIFPLMMHPVLKKNNKDLLAALKDDLKVNVLLTEDHSAH